MTSKRGLSGKELIERPVQVEASFWRRLRFENDLSCRHDLFDRHRGIAVRIARREFHRRPAHGLDWVDFEQLAHQGLLEAIDRFDPLIGVPFEAFARHRISGAISDGINRSSEGAAQYAHRKRVEAERLKSIRESASKEGASDPFSELTRQAVGLAIGYMVSEIVSIDELPDADHPEDPYQSLSWRELLMSVKREIEKLPDKERTVMREHYIHNLSFANVAQLMNLSKGRVSQLHRAALSHLKSTLNTFG